MAVTTTLRSASDETAIFNAMWRCASNDALLELGHAYFWSKGFSAFWYMARARPFGELQLLQRGMPDTWLALYEQGNFAEHDPIPGLALRHGWPARMSQLIAQSSSLTPQERRFLVALKGTKIANSFVFPLFGPFGRSGIVGLGCPLADDALDALDVTLTWAIAHLFHTCVSLFEDHESEIRLSPRERKVLEWLVKGKSATDIATILGISSATVSTHIQRIYEKFDVNDRVGCVTKALAGNYIVA